MTFGHFIALQNKLYLFYLLNFVFILGFRQNQEISRTINEKGCVQAGEEWIERNLITISSFVIFLAFLQVIFSRILSSLFSNWCDFNFITMNIFFRFWAFVLHKICVQTFLHNDQNGESEWFQSMLQRLSYAYP